MVIDNTTLKDLSIFNAEEEMSVFTVLNFTETNQGAASLFDILKTPVSDPGLIRQRQQMIAILAEKENEWPAEITNGTLMVMDKLYLSQIDRIPNRPSYFDAATYRLLHTTDYSLVRYTVGHAIDLVKGLEKIVMTFSHPQNPPVLQHILEQVKLKISRPTVVEMLAVKDKNRLSAKDKLNFGHFLLYHFKSHFYELQNLYGKLEAFMSLAKAMKHYHLVFPQCIESETPVFEVHGLWHILLEDAVGYDLELDNHKNFLFLTGANMAGKSTLIKAIGVGVFLAQLGMAVPAKFMRISIFDGMVTNIQVMDNILKGESFFFNEVMRVKATLTRISQRGKWLVLIDELFKGTNIEDAMRCSTAVIKGFLQIPDSLFVLSTHLYEIGEQLKDHPNILFRYFETEVKDDQLLFSYQLREGISSDRIGFIILRREGVLDLIEEITRRK